MMHPTDLKTIQLSSATSSYFSGVFLREQKLWKEAVLFWTERQDEYLDGGTRGTINNLIDLASRISDACLELSNKIYEISDFDSANISIATVSELTERYGQIQLLFFLSSPHDNAGKENAVH